MDCWISYYIAGLSYKESVKYADFGVSHAKTKVPEEEMTRFREAFFAAQTQLDLSVRNPYHSRVGQMWNRRRNQITVVLPSVSELKTGYQSLRPTPKSPASNFPSEPPSEASAFNAATTTTNSPSSSLGCSNSWLRSFLLSVSFANVSEFATQIWNTFHLEFSIFGNLTGQQSKEMMSGVFNEIKKKIPTCRPLLENEISKKRHLKLEDSKIQWVPQSCALIFLQIDSKSVINRANLRLLYQLIIAPTHTVLRGQEQLGYVAQASLYDANEPRGLYVLVGGAYDPKNVQGRIESFLEAFGVCLKLFLTP